MNIVLIGTGNTATVLGHKLKVAGHQIVQVFGRNLEAALGLAQMLDSKAAVNYQLLNTNADVYIIAVSDNAIEEVAGNVKLHSKIIVHTAASVSKEVLNRTSTNYGVFYPLQTLKKGYQTLPDIPIIIDANNKTTLHLLMELARSITTKVVEANNEQRLKLHLAAVLCNNFVNHLYTLTDDYCRKESLDFNLLKPLITETALRIENRPPQTVQTGPALRNDTETIKKHLGLLKHFKRLNKIYTLFTKSIQQPL